MGADEVPRDLVTFCEREYPRLVGALSLRCGDRLLAEELAQDTLLRVCERWAHVSQLASPGAWAHRVAMNLANSRFRRLGAERRALARCAPDVDTAGADPADLSLRAAVARLPRRQREALVYRYYLQFSVPETAAVLSASENAVRSLTKRAVQALREEVGVDV